MNLNEIAQQCMEDSEKWFPETAHALPMTVLCMAGEVGELANLIKKVERGSHVLDERMMYAIAMEITDVFIYVCNAAAIINLDLEEAYKAKREINEARFGNVQSANGKIAEPE